MSEVALRTLGIDPGLDMGWSLNSGGRPLKYGTVRFAEVCDKQSCWRIGLRSEAMELAIYQIVGDQKPDIIAVEQVPLTRFKTPVTSEGYMLVLVHTHRVAATLSIPIIMVNTSAVKKHATGSGKATKDEMIRNVATHWRIDLLKSQDDIADAMWIADKGEKEWKATTRH